MPAVTIPPERSGCCEYRFPLTTSDYMVEPAEVMMLNRRTLLCLTAAWPLAASIPGAALAQEPTAPEKPARAKARIPAELGMKKPKYYFKIREVNVGKNGDADLGKMARELFEKELTSRPEFTSELGGAGDPAAELAELKQRGLKGFRMSLR